VALVEGGGKTTSPTGQQITMHDVPFMDGPDVSPAMDGDSLGRDRTRNIFQAPLIGQQMETPEILDR
jgi:hypothetical protein